MTPSIPAVFQPGDLPGHAEPSVQRLRSIPLFTGLRDDQLAGLLAAGDVLVVRPEEVLFREAQPATHWWVLLSGTVELVRHVGHEDSVLAR